MYSVVKNSMLNRLNSPILHFRKELSAPPVAKCASSVAIRTIQTPGDVPAWLLLRDRAISGLSPLPRPWTAAGFQSEMLAKPWWRADRCWIAEATKSPQTPPTVIGSVTLVERAGEQSRVPVAHWLLVDPNWRRCGVGQLLMSYLEQAAWNVGDRELQLETHAGWSAAVAFYQSIGYAPARAPSPR